MLIVQNCALLNLKFSTSNRVQLLDDNRLLDKEIVSLIPYTGSEDFNHKVPYSSQFLPKLEDISNLSLYINLVNNKHKNTIALEMLNVDTSGQERVECFFNEKFDLQKSYTEVKGENIGEKTVIFPLYVFYKHRKLNKNISYNNAVTYKVNPEAKTLQLSQVAGKELEGKKIKKILIDSVGNSGTALGYINLIGKEENRRIEMLPLFFLLQHDTKNIYFDPIDIDYEKSTLQISEHSSPFSITFFY